MLGNRNQVTPYGTMRHRQTGTMNWTDPSSGSVYQLPQFTTTTRLSPEQRRLHRIQTEGETNLARLARNQSDRLGQILGRPVNTSGAPNVNPARLRQVGTGPEMQKSIGNVGSIQRDFRDGGTVWSGKGLQSGIAGDITQSYGGNFGKQRKRVEQALMKRMRPEIQEDRAALEAQLANQGLTLGSRAYSAAQDDMGRSVNDARLGAILAGGQEQSRLVDMAAQRAAFENAAAGQKFGQNLAQQGAVNEAQQQRFGQNAARAAFGNTAQQQAFGQRMGRADLRNQARQQQFNNRLAGTGFNNAQQQQRFGNQRAMRDSFLNEQYAQRNQPINEIAALLGTGQVQNPQFASTNSPQMPTVDIAGLTNANYNQRLAGWQQQQQNQQQLFGGLFGLGAAGISGAGAAGGFGNLFGGLF